jgi:hypothetical protein
MPLIVRKGNPAIGEQNGLPTWNGQPWPGGSSGTVDMSRYDSNDDGIVDSAETLHGLLSTISELNCLTGATGNIQTQIDALSNITNFRGSVDTHANLSTIVTPEDKDIVFVLTDETMSGVTSIYIYDGSDWVYVGTFDVELRNFLSDPISLANEVTGVLDESLIDPDLIRRADFASSLANIDNAVSLRHTHTNKTLLDLIGQDVDGWIPATVARLASPTFTGTPTAPTATAETSTGQIATTEFVKTAVDYYLLEGDPA